MSLFAGCNGDAGACSICIFASVVAASKENHEVVSRTIFAFPTDALSFVEKVGCLYTSTAPASMETYAVGEFFSWSYAL